MRLWFYSLCNAPNCVFSFLTCMRIAILRLFWCRSSPRPQNGEKATEISMPRSQTNSFRRRHRSSGSYGSRNSGDCRDIGQLYISTSTIESGKTPIVRQSSGRGGIYIKGDKNREYLNIFQYCLWPVLLFLQYFRFDQKWVCLTVHKLP